jgi:hypothetical protein
MKLMVLVLAAAVQSAPSTEYAWNCKIANQSVCGKTGCVEIKPTSSVFLYPRFNRYWRCPIGWKQLDVCDGYNAVVSSSGSYRNFELPGHTAFARVGPGLTFVEAVTSLDQVFVSHGTCSLAPPPLVRTR